MKIVVWFSASIYLSEKVRVYVRDIFVYMSVYVYTCVCVCIHTCGICVYFVEMHGIHKCDMTHSHV